MEESDDESIFEEEMPDMEGGMPENNVFGESSDPDAIAETVYTESVGLNEMQSADLDSVGNSGGILCTWDPNCLCMRSSTVSDYFVIVREVWMKTNIDILLVMVYAPHDRRDKRMLWDYLSMVVNNWEGEVIMMGDFNEVRLQSDRFGSVFHARDAEVFNSFILNAEYVEFLS
nr:RNA-directed DNA polymerase, eukaryota [Tanacetum cinerariifolium]